MASKKQSGSLHSSLQSDYDSFNFLVTQTPSLTKTVFQVSFFVMPVY